MAIVTPTPANTTQQKAATTAASGGIVSSANPVTAEAQATGSFDFFLKMLTTQLKNQDPTQPMDVNQMSQQIAQFSQVEQQVQTNANLTSLINANKQSQLGTAVSYIGKEIEATGNKGQLYSNSDAVFSYQLPSGTGSTVVTISDASGKAVFQGAGTTITGTNLVTWNGTNSFTGAKETPGDYTISVTAKDATGADISSKVTTHTVGNVVSVQNDASGNITLTVGDLTVNFSDILAVRQPIVSSNGTPSSSGNGA